MRRRARGVVSDVARGMALSVLSIVALAGCGSSFVPDDFRVPDGFVMEEFKVRPIRASDAQMDYEAVMESVDIIHAALLSDAWPPPGFTLEQDMEQLARKERMFERRRSFTYAVLSPDESRVLGSVYINRGVKGPDAAVFMWVRKDAFDRGMDPALERAVRQWVDRAWPFEWVVYPGRKEVPAGQVLTQYPIDDMENLISQAGLEFDPDVTVDGGGALRLSVGEPTTVELYELGDLDIEDATLIYEAKLRCENLGGRAYLEMWCTFGDEGDFFSRGLDSAVSGTMEWMLSSTPFFLQAGQNPTNVKLNLVVDGAGTAWIDDIRILKLPLE